MGRGPTFIQLDGLVNCRDVGGHRTADGRTVALGRVFRADSLHRLTPEGIARARALGVVTVIDLRTTDERARQPGPLPSRHVAIHEHDEDGHVLARRIEGRDEGEVLLRDLYRRLLEGSAPRFGEALTALAAPDALPAIVHCAGGKDRTGLTVALLLSALGVDRETVLDEYAARPGTAAHAARQDEVHAMFVGSGVEPDAARGLLSTPRWTMAETLVWVDETYGGVDGYLLGPAGVAPQTLDALRAALVG